MQYFKFLTSELKGPFSDYQYTLDSWTEPVGDIRPCKSGYHVVAIDQLSQCVNERLFEVEVDGEAFDAGDKFIFHHIKLAQELNWNEQTQRFSGAEIAASVLPIYEKQCPKDNRCRLSIIAALQFGLGEITKYEMAAAGAAAGAAGAAEAAAWAAGDAGAAAWAAAGAAEAAAWAAGAAEAAAWAAGAAEAAAGAAEAAAWAAEAAEAAAWAAGAAAHKSYSQIIYDYSTCDDPESRARKLLKTLQEGLCE